MSDLIKGLRGELAIDCMCAARSSDECGCEAMWPDQFTYRAADEIERLTAELALQDQANDTLTKQITETRDLAEHWAILAEQMRVELAECRKLLKGESE